MDEAEVRFACLQLVVGAHVNGDPDKILAIAKSWADFVGVSPPAPPPYSASYINDQFRNSVVPKEQ
jgi:hypothetical protein